MRICNFVLVAMFVLYPLGAFASNIDPAGEGLHYAWGENVGWVNLKPSSGFGMIVTDALVVGYAWGENVGWINLAPSGDGVINDGEGNLSGHAWGENVGWINFAPTSGGVTIDPTTGDFSGYAWGENTGWINFAPTEGGVKTSWEVSPELGSDDDGDSRIIRGCFIGTAGSSFSW
ncbi:MAG: hypothetical protein JRJ47_10755 [Deltaproteobacteria bacterium]|nr:hypothetical protein [Deltaproteobacteria bacterium]